MEFGIMYFMGVSRGEQTERYRLLLETVARADELGFSFVSTPERHFHEFGGLFPNPSVTSAGLATMTQKIQIRAGSLISPLHHPVRIAEEWSVVDNLSGGRVAVSFGSGWNTNDFIFCPDNYEKRQAIMYEQIEQVRRLWRGEPFVQKNPFGKDVSVELFPQPIQKELPIWVTSSGNVETFKSAAKSGAHILTHLIGQDLETLALKIKTYRMTLSENGHDPSKFKVTLMLHTFLGDSVDEVRAKVRGPFREYLRTGVKLEVAAAKGGGTISGGHKIEGQDVDESDMEALLDITFDRYFKTGALMGTPESCKSLVWQLKEQGIDEIACLVDFLDDREAILQSLGKLSLLAKNFAPEKLDQGSQTALESFMGDMDDDLEFE